MWSSAEAWKGDASKGPVWVRPELLASQGSGGFLSASMCWSLLVQVGVWGDSSPVENVITRTVIGT